MYEGKSHHGSELQNYHIELFLAVFPVATVFCIQSEAIHIEAVSLHIFVLQSFSFIMVLQFFEWYAFAVLCHA